MNTRQLRQFPISEQTGECNPFHHDLFRMGIRVGKNCVIMFENHDTDLQCYIVVCNTDTGERIAVELDEHGRMTDLNNPFRKEMHHA